MIVSRDKATKQESNHSTEQTCGGTLLYYVVLGDGVDSRDRAHYEQEACGGYSTAPSPHPKAIERVEGGGGRVEWLWDLLHTASREQVSASMGGVHRGRRDHDPSQVSQRSNALAFGPRHVFSASSPYRASSVNLKFRAHASVLAQVDGNGPARPRGLVSPPMGGVGADGALGKRQNIKSLIPPEANMSTIVCVGEVRHVVHPLEEEDPGTEADAAQPADRGLGCYIQGLFPGGATPSHAGQLSPDRSCREPDVPHARIRIDLPLCPVRVHGQPPQALRRQGKIETACAREEADKEADDPQEASPAKPLPRSLGTLARHPTRWSMPRHSIMPVPQHHQHLAHPTSRGLSYRRRQLPPLGVDKHHLRLRPPQILVVELARAPPHVQHPHHRPAAPAQAPRDRHRKQRRLPQHPDDPGARRRRASELEVRRFRALGHGAREALGDQGDERGGRQDY
ncbi:hypothetical protein V498_03070 [Pseudogymnoascus sp. VKM F-4517 (FW-2822)]|nr:hypothetical protein V498_03070 [Pseudogymnoascus sp. VKM F-4517 (FW-2822)]